MLQTEPAMVSSQTVVSPPCIERSAILVLFALHGRRIHDHVHLVSYIAICHIVRLTLPFRSFTDYWSVAFLKVPHSLQFSTLVILVICWVVSSPCIYAISCYLYSNRPSTLQVQQRVLPVGGQGQSQEQHFRERRWCVNAMYSSPIIGHPLTPSHGQSERMQG